MMRNKGFDLMIPRKKPEPPKIEPVHSHSVRFRLFGMVYQMIFRVTKEQ